MRIVLLCATQRGRRVLERLLQRLPQAKFTIFSFREEPWEPPFFEDIQDLALRHGQAFVEGKQVGDPRFAALWEAEPFDLLLCCSWRFMVPANIFRQARLGAFVLHDSLLPAYRGFSPTVWAMINGESRIGVTLLHMAEQVDAGDIADQLPIAIGPSDQIGDVVERVTSGYLEIIDRSLPQLLEGAAKRRPQNPSEATFCCKRLPVDNRVDWLQSATAIYNLVRAVTKPYPGAFTSLGSKKLIIWAARPAPPKRYVGGIPGRVVELGPDGPVVLAAEGSLLLTNVQLEGQPAVNAADLLRTLSTTLGR